MVKRLIATIVSLTLVCNLFVGCADTGEANTEGITDSKFTQTDVSKVDETNTNVESISENVVEKAETEVIQESTYVLSSDFATQFEACPIIDFQKYKDTIPESVGKLLDTNADNQVSKKEVDDYLIDGDNLKTIGTEIMTCLTTKETITDSKVGFFRDYIFVDNYISCDMDLKENSEVDVPKYFEVITEDETSICYKGVAEDEDVNTFKLGLCYLLTEHAINSKYETISYDLTFKGEQINLHFKVCEVEGVRYAVFVGESKEYTSSSLTEYGKTEYYDSCNLFKENSCLSVYLMYTLASILVVDNTECDLTWKHLGVYFLRMEATYALYDSLRALQE